MKIWMAILAAGLLCAACETSDNMASDSGNTKVAVNEDGEEMVCRSERVTGELVRREICKTRAQIKEENESSGRLQAGAIGTGGSGQGDFPAGCNGKGSC
ncbi:hypothetical protein [Euryhalocaulis caribicus]|uniref:hypothetical protein n=1 Tax=Euryhalocaulis caribicus TaxID=1161401 RepID=UPI0003AB1353|nr:hypothetical protein [Euryhalocaulis caribicus]